MTKTERVASQFPDDTYIVICRGDRHGRAKGPYVLATRQLMTHAQAIAYVETVSVSRDPIIVAGRFTTLREVQS